MCRLEQSIGNLSTKLINEGWEDYVPDPVKKSGLYKVAKAGAMPEIEGWMRPEIAKTVVGANLWKKMDDALKRGAFIGAPMGAAGGAALAAGIGSGGPLNRARVAAMNTFKSGSGSLKGRAAKALLGGVGSLAGSAARSGALAPLGALGGGYAGWQGGRETGAAILGAGALGGPLGLAIGPKSGAVATALGGYYAGDFAKSLETTRKNLARGGGYGYFRDNQSA